MRTMRFLLCSFLLTGTQTSLAQQKKLLYGKLADENGIPISNVSISFFKDSSLTAFQFCISNVKGEYHVALPVVNIRAELRGVGYKPFSTFLDATSFVAKDSVLFNITLERQSKLLDDVTMIAKQPVTENGDTTTFQASAFRNNRQENIEDLIKNMPGFTVKENGNIFFKNKYISRALIEGDDLYGNNYQQFTKKFSADKVSEIQVIEHFKDDDDILTDIYQSDETVINIKFGNAKTKLTGAIAAGVGLPAKRMDNKVNMLAIRPKMKAVLIGSNNRVGMLNPAMANSQKYGINLYERRQSVSVAEASIGEVPEERSRDNRSYFSSTNFLVRVSPSLQMKGKLFWQKDEYTRLNKNELQLLGNQTPLYVINDSNQFRKNNNAVLGEIEINYKWKRKFQLISTSAIAVRNENTAIAGTFNGNLQDQTLYNKNKIWEQSLRINYKFSNRISARLDVSGGYSPGSQFFSITPNAIRSYFQLPDTVVRMEQVIENPMNGLYANLQVMQKGSWGVTYSLGMKLIKNNLKSNMYGLGGKGNQYLSTLFDQNNGTLKQQNYFAAIKLVHWFLNGSSLQVSLPVEYIRQQFYVKGKNESFNFIQFKPSILWFVPIWKNTKLSLEYKVETETANLYQNLPYSLLTSYNSISRSNLRPLNAINHSFTASLLLFNLRKKRFISSISFSYSFLPTNQIVSSSFNNQATIYSLALYKYKALPRFTSTCYLSKTLLKPKLQLEVNLISLFNQGVSVINNKESLAKFSVANADLQLRSFYKRKLNFMYKSSVSVTKNRQTATANPGGDIKVSTHSVTNSFALYYKMNNKIDFSSENQFVIISPYQKKNQYIYLADLGINYSIISGKLNSRLVLRNLFNTKKVEFNEVSNDNLFISNSQYSLIPRFAIVKIEFKF
jgi:hypothetical protein